LAYILKIERSKIYRNLDILDEREREVVVGRFGLEAGGEERTQREIAKEREKGADEAVS
jgi:RNA polymerase sporulation-specific sigma factor